MAKNKESRFLKTPKCANTPMSYPELWKDAFGGKNSDSYCKCKEQCENQAPFRVCYNGEQYIASVFEYPTLGGCSLPHLGYETCKKSASFIKGRIWGRPAFKTHDEDLHAETRALVFELGCKKESAPVKFFAWLDGCIKNAWHSFEKESEIGKKSSKYVRKYTIYALTSAGENMTREKMGKLYKDCSKELDTLTKVLTVNSKDDKEHRAKIKEMERKLNDLTPLYEGSQAIHGDWRYNETDIDTINKQTIKPGDSEWCEVEEKMCREEDLYLLKNCLETLRRERPELAEVVDKFLAPVGKQNDLHQARDADVAQALNLPIHAIRRKLEKAESLLRMYMKQEGFVAEDINA